MKQAKSLAVDLVVAFVAAYLAMLQAGNSPADSLWAVLASAVYGAASALNPANSRYGLGAGAK
jgi:hypothetical protein